MRSRNNKSIGTGHQDQHWLLKLIHNSCSSDLHDIVDETFNELPVHQQDGSVYLKLIHDVVFNMTKPIVHVLQNWIKGFAKHGLQKVPGKNVRSLYNAAWNISKCLHEVDILPSDAAMGPRLPTTTSLVHLSFSRISVIRPSLISVSSSPRQPKTFLSQALDSYVVHVMNSLED